MPRTYLGIITGSFSTPAADNPTVVAMEAAYRHHGLDARYQLSEPLSVTASTWYDDSLNDASHRFATQLGAQYRTKDTDARLGLAMMRDHLSDGQDAKSTVLEGGGTLVAWTVIARGLPGFDSPYALATVQLDAGPSFIGQLHEWQGKPLASGMRVRLAIGRIKRDKDGSEVVGPLFVPVADEAKAR